AADEEEMAEARRKCDFYRPRGIPAEVLDAKQLAEAEPNLRPGLAGGLLLPADSVLYQPAVARWMLDEACKLGATVHTNQSIAAIEDDGLHMADGAITAGGRMVNATGAWAGQLTRNTAVKPKKGHLMVTERAPDFCFHEVVELAYIKSSNSGATEAVAFNVAPRPTGQVLIGSCRQLGVWDPEIDRNILNKMLRRAIEYMPGLAQLRGIRTWTGFRAATRDSLPLIGPCPGYENVWLATGHEGLGIGICTGTAKVLAAQMLGTPCEIPVDGYLPSREAARNA
ncbi:MAG TPA: FAD-dependent oxidoreductase, partial [Bryobacteraceae bacterium]|nr:FAD-dependent oxidoreductase [Bryobacteraceae bacterium]